MNDTANAHADDVRWSLDAIFPGLTSTDYRDARSDLERRVVTLEATLDRDAIGGGEPLSVDDATRDRLRTLLADLDDLSERLGDVGAFLNGFVSVDAFDDAAQAEMSTLRNLGVRIRAIDARVTAWIGRLDVGAALDDDRLADHAHFLARTHEAARKQLSDAEEALAAALAPSGGDAWARLHGDLVGKSTTPFTDPSTGTVEEAGLARLRVLQAHASRDVRRAAYHAELALLDRNAVAFAAAMNGVKGEVGTLARLRGWPSPLAPALFQNGITEAALDALHTAVRASFPVARRYLAAKARFLGLERLTWFDLLAPVSAGQPAAFTFAEASAFVQQRFDAFSPELGAVARRASDERWIDVLPRKGKRNGAFCMGVPGRKQSRIMLNFGGGLDDVFTLAHELGHAFHNDSLYAAGRTPSQARTPMTLAETASIFCETWVAEGLLADADDATRLAILEQDLRGATQLIVDIDSRFRLESFVFERRAQRDLSVAELDAAMLDAQRATYGDALDPDALHPRMWAQKPHYYSAGRSFYNFPYVFGFLFGVGVYARYRSQPDGFPARYRTLLSRTGMAPVADLAREMGIDVEDPGFWRDALSVTSTRVKEYERLVEHTLQGR